MTDCNSSCEWINYCGDAVVQRSGSCESGGTFNGYPCVSNITYAAEVCDNGSNGPNVYNGCEPGCLELGPRCGDGYTDSKTCSAGTESWCHTPSGLVKAEQCDNGPANSNASLGNDTYVSGLKNYGTCREDCTVSRCGDGVLDAVLDYDGNTVEECDCGAPGAYYEETKNQATTVNGKTVYICVADDGKELYNTVSAQRAALCRPNCRISRCGDGIKDAGEECDDGNFSNFDSCTSECKLNVVGDGIYAHSRSYLCEELKSLSSAAMTKMAERGVVDCGKAGQMTCSELASALTTDAAVKNYFEQNILHCCYNQKLGGGTDDKNCEIQLDGEYFKPKDLAIDRCVKYAWLGNEYEGTANAAAKKTKCTEKEADGTYSAIEMCEKCINDKCGRDCEDDDTVCKNQRTENCKHLSTQTEIDKCIEKNTYCDNTGWNIIGRCGDGKTDSTAGEICDNNITEEERKYSDLYNFSHTGGGPWAYEFDSGKWYNGHYCTGPCKGSCSEESPMCGGSVTSDCWEKGCTRQAHRSGAADNETSLCGDGFVDKYAGEECDYGISKHTDSWSDSYCSLKCKYNRNGSASGPIAKCGDGQIQSMNEVCDDGNTSDDDYCVNNCQTYYGTCGDKKINGPGYTLDSKWTPADGGGTAGPEDCDTMDERSQSLFSAGVQMSKICNATTCKRVGTCGDGTRDYRFEGCDCGTGNDTANKTCTVDGKSITCFKGCKSNPKGSLMKATNSEINGWACDPDHPMTHPETLVRIEITDATGASVGSKTLATTKDIDGNDVTTSTYYNVNDIAKECGGGSKHGWTYDPSKSDTAMNWEGKTAPFKVKAYATSLDGSPETEVFIGEKEFVRSMMCGDNMTSKCESIEVTFPPASEGGSPTTEFWSNGRVCYDYQVVDGCAAYGLTHGVACIDEQCDKGSANGDDKDCDSKCQWTKCGDSKVQANATGVRPDGTSYEECESGKTNCSGLLEKEVNTDQILNQATCSGTSNPKCKWNRNTCTIKSKCPALSTGITSWGGNYKAAHAGDYIEYKDGDDEYTRTWTGTGSKGWGNRETVVKYDTVASTQAEKDCSYKCSSKFTWDNSKCVPKTDIEISCNNCTDSHGVWLGTTKSCKNTAKTIHQTVTINSDGAVTCVPGDSSGGCNVSAVDAAYGTTASTTKCIWECDSSSKWDGNSCLANSKTFNCTGLPSGMHWISVKLDSSNNIVMSDAGTSLTISQTLNTSTLTYNPSDSDLAAINVNDGSKSPKQLKAQGKLSQSGPTRCYYGCPSGSYYDTGTSTCKTTSCGDGVVNNADCSNVEGDCLFTVGANEKCDDGRANNGKYNNTSGATRSYCKSDCRGRISGGTEYFCGDGVIQKKNSESCPSFLAAGTCKLATTSNYSGADDISSFVSEQCDGQTDHQTLCKLATGKTDKTFYKQGSSSSAPSCSGCKISNGTSATGCNYCGDGVKAATETCEIASNGDIITEKGNYGTSCNSTTYNTSGTTNKTETWTAPATGRYLIEVYGAAGGTGHGGNASGCNGAYVYGQYDFVKGDQLTIVSGGKGSAGATNYGGYGGSASAVVKGGSALLIAGGGGGGGWSGQSCSGGQASNSGADAGGCTGGSSGNNGGGGSNGAGAGVGWNGKSGYVMSGGSGGSRSKSNCNDTTYYAYGGGGGGYSGGAGSCSDDTGGGGGGSYYSGYVSGTNGWQAAVNSGSGYVVITQKSYKGCSNCSLSSSLTTCN